LISKDHGGHKMYEIISIALIAAIGATTLVLFWLALYNIK